METIDERGELLSNEEAISSGSNPFLIKKVLLGIFEYLSVNELKTARLVCEHWKYFATPYLQEKSIVKLQGVCSICQSEFKSTKKTTIPHDHRHTISFYKFILEVQSMLTRQREQLFYKNFQISKLNLYFIPRLSTEPTKYFLLFLKLLGAKVFELVLKAVQLCPTESVYRIVPLFKNLEIIKFDRVTVWIDPVSNNDTNNVEKTGVSYVNSFLTSLTFCGDWVSEEFLNWNRIFKASPALQELNLMEVPRNEIVSCVSALVSLPEEDLEAIKIRRLTIHARAELVDHLNMSATSTACSDLDEEGDSDDADDADEEMNCCDTNKMTTSSTSKEVTNSKRARELELSSMDLNNLLTQVATLFTITDLNLRLGYIEEGSKFPAILRACCDKLNSLTLSRESAVYTPQTEIVMLKQNPFEIEEKCMQFPFIKRLELAHNFIDNLDEIKQSFPSLQRLRMNVVPTEFRTRKTKSYHTYLRTNVLLTMKQQMINTTVTDLTWNLEDARNFKTGIRTVVYKSNALKHIPRIFPQVTRLTVSITKASDLHVIFRDMEQLTELTVLRNSFYRTKDEDIIGWTNSESDSEEEDDDENFGEVNSTRKKKKKIEKIQNAGIKQLTNLERLSLENNNCCLTNKAVRQGFVLLRKLRSLHISRGKKITLYALRVLTRCPYLVSVNLTKLNSNKNEDDYYYGEKNSDDEAIAAYELAIAKRQETLAAVMSGNQLQEEQQQTNSPYSLRSPVSTPDSDQKGGGPKTKIPSLVLSPYNRSKMRQYTTPKKISSSRPNHVSHPSKGRLPILISTSSTTTATATPVPALPKENLILPVIITKKSSASSSSSTPDVVITRTPDLDPLPDLRETDLQYILSLSETELEKFEEDNRKRKKSQEKLKEQLGQKLIVGETRMKEMANLTLNDEKVKRKSKAGGGGRYELGFKYHKIGGKRYSFVTTKYTVNGRTYQLIRRKYENEGQKEKIWATHRAWRAKKRLQQQREAAKAKNMDNDWDSSSLLKKSRLNSMEDGEESEYERSIKDYDEEDDAAEEYCDEDFDDEYIDHFTPECSSESEETSEEEGIFLDSTDSNYEGDKEFYDDSASSYAPEDDDDDSDSDFQDGKSIVKTKSSGVKRKEKKFVDSKMGQKRVTFQTEKSSNKNTQIPKRKTPLNTITSSSDQGQKNIRKKEVQRPCQNPNRIIVEKRSNNNNYNSTVEYIEKQTSSERHYKVNIERPMDSERNNINKCNSYRNQSKCISIKKSSSATTETKMRPADFSGLNNNNVEMVKRRYRSAEDPLIVEEELDRRRRNDKIVITVEQPMIREDSLEDFESEIDHLKFRIEQLPLYDQIDNVMMSSEDLLLGVNNGFELKPEVVRSPKNIAGERESEKGTENLEKFLDNCQVQLDEEEEEDTNENDDFDATLAELRCNMMQEMSENVRDDLIMAT